MNKSTYSVQQVSRKWKLSEAEIREALRSGELNHSFTPKWGISEQDVLVWLLNTGRITLDEFKEVTRG